MFTLSDRLSGVRGAGLCTLLTEALGALPVCRSCRSRGWGFHFCGDSLHRDRIIIMKVIISDI